MPTRKIDHEKWATFFEEFTRKHASKPVSVEAFGPGTGSHEASKPLPLVGISLENKGSEIGSVIVMLGTKESDHITHTVTEPAQVWLDSSEFGGDDVLEIRTADGLALMLRFYQGHEEQG